MSNRIFDTPSINKLANIIEIAKEHSLAVSIDFCQDLWIMQMFDLQERMVISASGKTSSEVITKLFNNWLSKTGPKI